MFKRSLVIFVVFASCLAIAGEPTGKRAKLLQPLKIDNSTASQTQPATGRVYEPPHATAINWVAVDTMGNAFGPASRGVKPIAYDSASNVVALIHRGAITYARSTGELWYNISRNSGLSWRRAGSLNTGVATSTRYPSCAIANPTNAADTSSLLFVYAAPQLTTAGVFGGAMYGVDFPLGGNGAVAFETSGDGSFWSNASIWTVPGGTDLNWVIYRNGTVVYDDIYRWHTTTDFSSITEGVPGGWETTSFNSQFGLDIGGHYRNGNHYFGKWGQWTGDPNIVDNPGYSVSTNGGVTWGAWIRPQPDFRSIPGLGGKDWWTYGGPGAYSFDMVIDASGRVHFFGVIVDTLTPKRDLVEIYETGSGWNSKIIKSDLNVNTLLIYNTLNQMGNHLNAATNASGSLMALAWLDAAPGDSLPDIWFSWRQMNGTSWSTPTNLTETPGYAELLLHAAPTLKTNSASSYTMFLGRSYESGVSTYPPTDVNPTVFYAGTYTWTLTDVPVEQPLPQHFALEQNYPNPFNPATKIQYRIPFGSDVKLSVYNMLGQEVAALVNGFRTAGSYEADFAGTNLASGVYYYTLTAGQYLGTKKMLLLR